MVARHRIGDKLLSEPMLTRFTDAYMRHYGDMSKLLNQASTFTAIEGMEEWLQHMFQ